MHIYHNSQNTYYRAPFGAVQVTTSVTLSIDVADVSANTDIFLEYYINGSRQEIRMEQSSSPVQGPLHFSAVITFDDKPGICWYYFRIECEESTFFYGNNSRRLGGEGTVTSENPVPYQITVYIPDRSPSWFKEGIVYQIFPDRFARGGNWKEMQEKARQAYTYGTGNGSSIRDPFSLYQSRPSRSVAESWQDAPEYPRDSSGAVSDWRFSGGNLRGISEKLPYLAGLGVTVIYLNPVFRASSNHKYDTSDYMHIDEAFGSDRDFREMCETAAACGISVILDGVFSHTGCDSIYFNKFGRFDEAGACQGPESKWFDWYTFTENGYECWWGIPDLPNVREMNESYQDFIFRKPDSVIRKWLKLGAKGWRLDVADELPDEFIRGIRKAMLEEDPDSLLMGEVWEDATNKVSYDVLREYFLGNELQSTMNYPFRSGVLDFLKGNLTAGDLAMRLMSLKENYPEENFRSALNLIGSHDRARILTELADGQDAIRYQLSLADRLAAEPRLIGQFTDEQRSLMEKGISPWDAVKETWRIPEDKMPLAVSRLKAASLLQYVMPGVPCIYYGDEAGMQGFEDPYNRGTFPWGNENAELEKHYHFLGRLRREYPVLTDGDFRAYALTDHVICFERWNADMRLRLLVNRGIFEWETCDPDFGETECSGTYEDILTGEQIPPGLITLPPLRAMLLKG